MQTVRVSADSLALLLPELVRARKEKKRKAIAYALFIIYRSIYARFESSSILLLEAAASDGPESLCPRSEKRLCLTGHGETGQKEAHRSRHLPLHRLFPLVGDMPMFPSNPGGPGRAGQRDRTLGICRTRGSGNSDDRRPHFSTDPATLEKEDERQKRCGEGCLREAWLETHGYNYCHSSGV